MTPERHFPRLFRHDLAAQFRLPCGSTQPSSGKTAGDPFPKSQKSPKVGMPSPLEHAALRDEGFASDLPVDKAAFAKAKRRHLAPDRDRFDDLKIAQRRKTAERTNVARLLVRDRRTHRPRERPVGALDEEKPFRTMRFYERHQFLPEV